MPISFTPSNTSDDRLLNALAWCLGLLSFVLLLAHTRAAQMGLMGLCVLLFIPWVLRAGTRIFSTIPRPFAYSLAMWCVVTTASCAWSQVPLLSLSLVAQNVWLPLMFFLMAYVLGASRTGLRAVISGTCLGFVVMGVAAAVALGLHRFDLLQGEGLESLQHPWMRWYPGPGLGSTFVLLALPFLYWAFREKLLPRWALVLVGLLVFIGAASLNRIFWPVLVFSCFALLMGYEHNRQRYCRSVKFWLLGALALLLVFSFILIVTLWRGHLGLGSWYWVIQNKLMADPRLEIWKIWVSIGSDQHPLLGTGFGKDVARQAYKPWLDLKFVPGIDLAGKSHPHNLLLSTWIQTGMIGVVSFLTLVWGMLKAGAGLSRTSPRARHAAAALVALVCAMLLKNMTDDFYDRTLVVLFWSYFGILLGFASQPARPLHDNPSA